MVEMSKQSHWEKELTRFHEVLASPKGQAIVIVGPEGSGKSSLLRAMVMRGKKVEKFYCDGKIHHVGPNDNPNKVLRDIVPSYKGGLAFLELENILRSLSNSVEEYGGLHRRVVGVDAHTTQLVELKKLWLEIIPQLPDKVKFIFTQRPNGILATNKQFMGLPNVVRIDIEAPPSSDERQKVFDTDEDLRKKVNEKGLVTEGLQGAVQEKVDVEGIATVEVLDKIKITGMSVAEHGWGDRIADKDKLGFRPYVEVVARFLTHEETELPLTLSVEGEWGSGKSSFLLQLKNEIGKIYKEKGREKAFIVEFDPWRHDKNEALWAAFALTFMEQVRGGLFELRRWIGDWRLFFMRYRWKDGWIDMMRFFTSWLVFIVLCVLLGVLTIRRGPEWVSYLCDNILLVAEEVKTEAGEDSSGGVNGRGVIKWILGGGGLAAVAGGLASVLGLVRRITGNPLKVNLKKYIKHPQYADRVSFIERFHNDFKKIVSAYSGEERVYVFIDDLDRCAIPKAAELMESINLMISENPRLVFVMGMDREKVAAGLAVKHEKLLPYLAEPTKKKDADKDEDKDEVKRRRGVRYGYSFIEKFIQVPFRLPQPDEKCIRKMLMEMSGQLKEEKALPKKEQIKKTRTKQVKIEDDKKLEMQRRAETKQKIDKVFTKFDGDDHNFRAIVLMVSKAFDFNPRRAKQFVNIFRLRAATAKVTGLYEPKDGKRLTFEQLGKFVGIGLGWPLLIRDIERKPALLEELVEEAEGQAEGKANEKKKKPKENGLYFERWADDEKLMELMKAGCENDKDAEKCRRFSLKGLDVKKLLRVAPRVMSDEEEMV